MKLGAFLAAQALAQPDKKALVCGDQSMTFRELHEASDRVAVGLRNAGVTVGDRVAMLLPNCCEFVLLFMAIVKCGGIALPLNKRLSPKELRSIIDDAEPAVLFFEGGDRSMIGSLLEGLTIGRCAMDGTTQPGELSFQGLMSTAPAFIDVPPEFDDCMISYTSGTTGRPKGVITTQANYIVSNGYLNGLQWGLTADDRILITTPLAHRAGFARVGNVIILGATLFMQPSFNVEDLIRIIEEQAITLIGIVPTIGRMLLPAIEANPDGFKSLRVLVATGEAFPVEIKQRLQLALPGLKIFSFFAMTEAGAIATLRPEQQLDHAASIGRATPGVEVRLVDDAGRDVPIGEAGEIWVRSGLPGQYLIFRTYFRQEQTTRDAFENGWFKTGDIARQDDDGFFYIVDRKKDMVVSGGYNVYSKEVELALRRHEAVADAAVIGVPDPAFGEAVAAFIECESGKNVAAEELLKWCAEEIAGYKKPKYIIPIAELPRNNMGKVLKQDLRKLFEKEYSHS
jgi:long-chain acyl-CoA synthetase